MGSDGGDDEATVKETFGQGKMFFMPAAKQLGMVDSFGTMESVVAEKRKTTSKARSQRTHCVDRSVDEAVDRL